MEVQQFVSIWNDIAKFYGNISTGKQKVYFEAFEYLPAGVVEEIIRQGMKKHVLMPSVIQLEEIRNAVVAKQGRVKTTNGQVNNDPPIPGSIRASNCVMMRMVQNAHRDRVDSGEKHLLDKWPALFRKYWDSRKRLEVESNCVEFWLMSDRTFKLTLDEIHTGIWVLLLAAYEEEEPALQNEYIEPF